MVDIVDIISTIYNNSRCYKNFGEAAAFIFVF